MEPAKLWVLVHRLTASKIHQISQLLPEVALEFHELHRFALDLPLSAEMRVATWGHIGKLYYRPGAAEVIRLPWEMYRLTPQAPTGHSFVLEAIVDGQPVQILHGPQAVADPAVLSLTAEELTVLRNFKALFGIQQITLKRKIEP